MTASTQNTPHPRLQPIQRLLLTEAEAAAAIGYTARMLQGRRRRGDGPDFVRVGVSSVRYRIADLEAWDGIAEDVQGCHGATWWR